MDNKGHTGIQTECLQNCTEEIYTRSCKMIVKKTWKILQLQMGKQKQKEAIINDF